MMSITNRSRILALVLAVAMVLSLVPVMAAAESGKDSVGYALITYPADESNENYKISTVYYGADGKKANGDVAVRISNESDPLFYYNIIAVKDGVIDLTVSLAGAAEGKYDVEFITGNMDDSKNDAYFFYCVDADDAIAERDKDLKAATSFDSIAIQQKVVSLDNLVVYDRYLVNKENSTFSNEYLDDVLDAVKTENPIYTNDDGFVNMVEEATVVALFDEVTKANKGYFTDLLADSDVLDVIKNANVSSDFNDALKLFNKVDEDDLDSIISQIVIKLWSDGFGDFDTIDDTADKLADAMNAVLDVEEEEEVKDVITNNNTGSTTGGGSGFGGGSGSGNTYVPPVPTNPVIHVSTVFTDLDSNYWWVIEPLQTLYTNGYINGRTASTFAPGENITRAEFLKILLLELNMVDEKATVTFDDVKPEDWFYMYVASGANKGIVKGRTETGFAPNDQITREEICIMTMRAVRALNIDLGSGVAAGAFTDEASIADYAVEDVHALKAAGIISGRDTGAFDPKANATRAEAVKILYGVYAKQ